MKLRKTVYYLTACLTVVLLSVALLSACSLIPKNSPSVTADETPGPTPSNEIVADTAWIASGDGSYMTFAGENDFVWYLDKNDTDDNYVMGTYRFYIGSEATEYITVDLKEYGVTVDELLDYFKRNEGDPNEEYSVDNFVCMTVTNNSFLLDGEEQLSEPRDISYYGFLLNDGTYLDIANMTTGAYYGFTKE